jgi:peptidoglycan-N-acetylglucosamine deacetylase
MSRRLTLTFDNGPTPGVTEHVLEELENRGIRSTFFVVGRDLERAGSRELVKRAKDAGHWIGNHTMTHTIQFGKSDDPSVPDAEISSAQRLLGELAEPEKLFRPWGGGVIVSRDLLSPGAVELLMADGYTLVLWNSIPRDWEDASGWVERAITDIQSREWTLLVLHDIASGAMNNLGTFLDRVIGLGVTLTQEFPDECVPIRGGRLVGPLDQYLR